LPRYEVPLSDESKYKYPFIPAATARSETTYFELTFVPVGYLLRRLHICSNISKLQPYIAEIMAPPLSEKPNDLANAVQHDLVAYASQY
jgi:hypothetical protein